MPIKPPVDMEMFKRRCARMPSVISKEIRDLARELSGDYPQFVPVLPDPLAKANECFFNVRSKVERDGGSVLNGWLIREWPKVIIEAEHHAVWSDGAIQPRHLAEENEKRTPIEAACLLK